MLRIILLLLAKFFTMQSFSQDSCVGQVPDQKYLEEIVQFFQQVGKEEFRTDSIDVREKVDMNEFVRLLQDGDWKSKTLTAAEMQELKDMVKNPPLKCWKKSLIPKASILLKDSLIYSDAAAKLKNSYYTLSVPLFFRDFTLCLFSSGYHCGLQCGRGHLSIYKKIDGTWRQEDVLVNWAN